MKNLSASLQLSSVIYGGNHFSSYVTIALRNWSFLLCKRSLEQTFHNRKFFKISFNLCGIHLLRFFDFPVWCKFLTTVEWSPFHSAISQVVLHGSASIMVFMATLIVIDLKLSFLLHNFFKPMLSWLLTDGSLDKCLVDIAISFCCLKFHLELIKT